MGYGLGVALIVVGLIFALALASYSSVLAMVGWILVVGGVLVVVLTAVQLNTRRRSTTTTRTVDAQGRETITETHRNDAGPGF